MSNSGKQIVRDATPDVATEKVIQEYSDGAKHVTLIDSEGNSQVFKLIGPEGTALQTEDNILQESINKMVLQLTILNAYMAEGFDQIITEEDVT